MAGFTKQGHDASVQFVIDNNVTLGGGKLQEIYNNIREIITISRATVRFGIFVTSPQSRRLVSDLKPKINTNNIWQQLRGSEAAKQTNFYDAWGLALNEIQYDEMSYSHLVLCTNGVDTTSFIYNLDSVINLLNQKLGRNPKLRVTLIQAGPRSVLTNALQTKCPFGDRCSCITVQDSNAGIRSGFEQVKAYARLELVQISPYTEVTTNLNALSFGGLRGAKGGAQVQSYAAHNNLGQSAFIQSHLATSAAAKANSSKFSLIQASKEKVVNTTPQSYKVWVGNLPMVNQSLILDYLKQWGGCKIETINGCPTQWAVVAYENQSSVEYAVKYGNASTFRGQVININKI